MEATVAALTALPPPPKEGRTAGWDCSCSCGCVEVVGEVVVQVEAVEEAVDSGARRGQQTLMRVVDVATEGIRPVGGVAEHWLSLHNGW